MNKTKVLIITVILVVAAFGLFVMHRCVKHETSILKTIHDARSGRTIIIKLITDNFSEHEPLFQAVFTSLYAKHPHVMDDALKQFPTIEALATLSFDFEKKEFDAHKPNLYFVQAIIDKKPVGYLSFEIQPDGSAYMRNLAVDYAYQGMGIGKQLTNAIFDIKPKATKIKLHVHRLNFTAVGMYKHLGFAEVPITLQKEFNPDPKFWMEMEFIKK